MTTTISGLPANLFRRLRPSARVWLLTVLIAVTGLALAELRSTAWIAQDLPIRLEWWMLAPAFAASEIFVIHYQFRREQYTFTLAELPLALGLFFASWPAIIAARLVGGGIALRLHRKQAPMKMAFNLACNVLETSVAVVLFRAVAGQYDGQSAQAIAAAVVAIGAGVLIVTICIALAISIYEGRPSRKNLGRLITANLVVGFTNVSLAMVAVSVLWVSRGAGWLLLVVAVILFIGYRSYARLQQKHDDLELLYDFTRRSGQALQVDSAMRELLSQVRTVLRAGTVQLVVPTRTNGGLVRSVLGDDDEIGVMTVQSDRLWDRIVEIDRPMLAASPVRDEGLAADLEEHGLKDAVVAPLRRGDGSINGMMLAGNRLGELRTFTNDDLKLFEALANHASVSLENRHLIDRLRTEAADKAHQALHDSLTGLPNRVLFQQRIELALTTSGQRSSKVAVLLLDLDRFKEVNDTLGHHNGDLLLQEIGDRLRRTLRAGDTVARLGGDEFAVLLPDLAGAEAAVAAANGIRHALERPFSIDDVTLDVGASVGIAIWPDHGEDATILLQRADVAMYTAKESQGGVDLYDPDRDTYSLERLSLVGELRQAIERGELAVHYQPKADIASGDVTGMEALVRWTHARHGPVPPEEIIGIAEQTGLIRPLTLWVLNQALHDCRSWRRQGRQFDVAVNLSIRNILDAELPNDVLKLLNQYGLPASALTFEITESSIMVDPVRTVSVLSRLRTMGVQLAIDDFGTGYSSFSHLRRLPVDEIKIDKSFVLNLATDENDLVIVRSIVDLGRNLGLRVVAEGVEDTGAWRLLDELGCDTAQGYLLTRPLSAADLETWLSGYQSEVLLARQPDEDEEADTPTAAVVPIRTPAVGQR